MCDLEHFLPQDQQLKAGIYHSCPSVSFLCSIGAVIQDLGIMFFHCTFYSGLTTFLSDFLNLFPLQTLQCHATILNPFMQLTLELQKASPNFSYFMQM